MVNFDIDFPFRVAQLSLNVIDTRESWQQDKIACFADTAITLLPVVSSVFFTPKYKVLLQLIAIGARVFQTYYKPSQENTIKMLSDAIFLGADVVFYDRWSTSEKTAQIALYVIATVVVSLPVVASYVKAFQNQMTGMTGMTETQVKQQSQITETQTKLQNLIDLMGLDKSNNYPNFKMITIVDTIRTALINITEGYNKIVNIKLVLKKMDIDPQSNQQAQKYKTRELTKIFIKSFIFFDDIVSLFRENIDVLQQCASNINLTSCYYSNNKSIVDVSNKITAIQEIKNYLETFESDLLIKESFLSKSFTAELKQTYMKSIGSFLEKLQLLYGNSEPLLNSNNKSKPFESLKQQLSLLETMSEITPPNLRFRLDEIGLMMSLYDQKNKVGRISLLLHVIEVKALELLRN